MTIVTSLVGKALLGAAVGALAFGSAQAQELKNINFMSSNDGSCGTYPQFMIQAFGYLEEEGYKVTLLGDACATRAQSYGGETVPARQVHAAFLAALNGFYAKVVNTHEL